MAASGSPRYVPPIRVTLLPSLERQSKQGLKEISIRLGSLPEVGRVAAEDSIDEIMGNLAGMHM